MTGLETAALVLCIILVVIITYITWMSYEGGRYADVDITGISDSFPKYVKTGDFKQSEAAYDIWMKSYDLAEAQLLTPDKTKLNPKNRALSKELIRRTRKWVPQDGGKAIKVRRGLFWMSLNVGTQLGNDFGVWLFQRLNIPVPPVLPNILTL